MLAWSSPISVHWQLPGTFQQKKNMFWLWIKALQRQMLLKLATLLLSQFSLSDFNFQIICFVFFSPVVEETRPAWLDDPRGQGRRPDVLPSDYPRNKFYGHHTTGGVMGF
jgi:hypothetical protein